jgi:hypothetical protein
VLAAVFHGRPADGTSRTPVGVLFTTLHDPDVSAVDRIKAPFKSWLGRGLLILWLFWLWNFINGTM